MSEKMQEKKKFIRSCIELMAAEPMEEPEDRVDRFFSNLGHRSRLILAHRIGYFGTIPELEELGRNLMMTHKEVKLIEYLAVEKALDILKHALWIIPEYSFIEHVKEGLKEIDY